MQGRTWLPRESAATVRWQPGLVIHPWILTANTGSARVPSEAFARDGAIGVPDANRSGPRPIRLVDSLRSEFYILGTGGISAIAGVDHGTTHSKDDPLRRRPDRCVFLARLWHRLYLTVSIQTAAGLSLRVIAGIMTSMQIDVPDSASWQLGKFPRGCCCDSIICVIQHTIRRRTGCRRRGANRVLQGFVKWRASKSTPVRAQVFRSSLRSPSC